MNIRIMLTILISVFYLSAYANQSGSDNPHPVAPAKESVDACNSKVSGDTCSFTGRNNNVFEGTCRKGPDGQGELACAPKPPKEAVDACSSKANGENCSFTGKNNDTVTGSCSTVPYTNDVACRPANPPKP